VTAVQEGSELVIHDDGTVWERWYEREGGWQQARAVYFTDDGVISSLPDLVIENAPTPIHRRSGLALTGCRWATRADAARRRAAEQPPEPPADPAVLVADMVPTFLAVSCSTERARVLVDIGQQDRPDGPVTTLTVSVDTAAAVDLYRNLSGALRYLGIDVDTLYPGTVTMTHRR
jgi:hypothetical protein